ncbi:MAG: acyl carrier protein [Clostridia bacterium]|nr:acyl carrier protein [Clostridia bacterium]
MFEKLVDIILNYVEPEEEITEETGIKRGLGLSSFDLVCLSDEIHNEFGVVLNADDFRECDTVGKLVAHLECAAR